MSSSAASSQPDVRADRPRRLTIWIMPSTPAWSLNCYGDDLTPTPHFNALAARSRVGSGCYGAMDESRLRTLTTQLSQHSSMEVDIFDPQSAGLSLDAVGAAMEIWAPASNEALSSLLDHRQSARIHRIDWEVLGSELEDWRRNRIWASAVALAADEELGRRWPLIESLRADESLVVFMTPIRGGPDSRWWSLLGEEATHCGLFLHSGGATTGSRSWSPLPANDLIQGLIALSERGRQGWLDWEDSWANTVIMYQSGELRARRTADWLLIDDLTEDATAGGDVHASGIGSAGRSALFRLPDDLWLQLDLSQQREDVIDALKRH